MIVKTNDKKLINHIHEVAASITRHPLVGQIRFIEKCIFDINFVNVPGRIKLISEIINRNGKIEPLLFEKCLNFAISQLQSTSV